MGSTMWRDVAFWSGFAIIAIGMIGGAFLGTRRDSRRAYWLCWLFGGLIMVFAAGVKDTGLGVTLAVFCVVMSVMIAFLKSSHLKIGGKIYALSLDDRQPDPEDGAPPTPRPADSYGDLSAAAFWWIWAVFVGGGGLMIFVDGWEFRTGWPTVFFNIVAGLTGYIDSSQGFRRLRGQYLQAAVVTVGSIPLFGAAPVLYLLTYEIGKRVRRRAAAVTRG